MDDILVAQRDAERFDVTVGLGPGGRRLRAVLPRHVREGLGLAAVAPSAVVHACVAFLLERGALDGVEGEVRLAVLAGRYPEWPEEVRARVAI